MGKTYAPALANIYLRRFDVTIKELGADFLPYYFRFIDDTFMIWLGTLDQFKVFEGYVNNLIPDIHVTFTVRSMLIEYLDVVAYTHTLILQTMV